MPKSAIEPATGGSGVKVTLEIFVLPSPHSFQLTAWAEEQMLSKTRQAHFEVILQLVFRSPGLSYSCREKATSCMLALRRSSHFNTRSLIRAMIGLKHWQPLAAAGGASGDMTLVDSWWHAKATHVWCAHVHAMGPIVTEPGHRVYAEQLLELPIAVLNAVSCCEARIVQWLRCLQEKFPEPDTSIDTHFSPRQPCMRSIFNLWAGNTTKEHLVQIVSQA